MKKTKKNQINWVWIVVLFLLVGWFCIKVNNTNPKKEETYSNPQIVVSNSKIEQFVSTQQNFDGGFVIAVPNIDLDLLETYYAIDSLRLINKSNNNISTQEFIENMDINMILNEKSIYSLKSCYYYLELCELLNINVKKDNLEKIINYINCLKTEEGFFYNTPNDKKKGAEEYFLDSYYLETLIFGHRINAAYNKGAKEDKLQEELLKCIDFNEYSGKMCALISTYLEISVLYNYDNNEYMEKIEGFLKEFVNTEFEENIGVMNDVFVIAKYVNYEMKDIFSNFILQLWKEKGFSISEFSESVNIKATNQVLHIIKEFEIFLEDEKIEKIQEFILDAANYSGYYTFTDRKSNMFSSYYAVMILELLEEDNEIILQNLVQFLDSKRKEFDDLLTPEQLFYLKIGKILNYDVPVDEKYFDEQFQILKKVDIVNNAELAILLLETAEMYDYKVPQDIQTLVLEKVNQYNKQTEDKMALFINECNLAYIKLLIQKQIEKKEIEYLVTKFEENIKDWMDMLYIFQKVFKVVYDSKNEVDISDNTIFLILTEIERKMKYGVFMYSTSDIATFDSVYELLKIVKILENS